MTLQQQNMDDKPLLSVILPCYNCTATIEKTLQSLFLNKDESCMRMEIIAVNDGSTDSTLDLLGNLQTRYPELKVESKENGGLCSARNAGLNAASGKYIYIIDPDDFIFPGVLPQVIREMERNASSIGVFGIKQRMSNEEVNNVDLTAMEVPQIEFNEPFQSTTFFSSPAFVFTTFLMEMVFRKDMIGNDRFCEDICIGEDAVFIRNQYLKDVKMTFYKKPLKTCGYRILSTGLTLSKNPERVRNRALSRVGLLREYSKMKAGYKGNNPDVSKKLELLDSFHVYGLFVGQLGNPLLSKTEINNLYLESEKNGKFPIVDFTNEPYYPCDWKSKLLRQIVNHKWLYKTVLNIRYLLK